MLGKQTVSCLWDVHWNTGRRWLGIPSGRVPNDKGGKSSVTRIGKNLEAGSNVNKGVEESL